MSSTAPGKWSLSKRWPWVIALLLGASFLFQALAGNQLKSIGGDEPGFIGGGYAVVKWHDYAYFNYIPPLMPVLASLPLLQAEISGPQGAPIEFDPRLGYIAAGYKLIAMSGLDLENVTFYARLPTIFMGTALVLCAFVFVRGLLGPGAGVAAAALIAFAPNLLAHGKLATSDVGCALLMFASVGAYWWARREPSWGRLTLLGVLTGLALLSKYTGLLLGPIFVTLFLTEIWLGKIPGAGGAVSLSERPFVRQFLELVFAAVIAWLVVGAAYHGSFDYSLYLKGIERIYVDHLDTYEFYLLGEYAREGPWYYYLAVMGLKLPLGALALVVGAVGLFLVQPTKRLILIYLLVPAVAVLLVSSFDGSKVGIRRIIPALPFLLAMASVWVAMNRRWISHFALLLVGLAVLETTAAFPHHLAFFNVAARSLGNPIEMADDSNTDWDLDVPALVLWQREHAPEENIRAFLRGSNSVHHYGLRGVTIGPNELAQPVRAIYAIGAHNLIRMRRFEQLSGAPFDWLTRYEPIAIAGASIYIYDMREPAGKHEPAPPPKPSG